MTQRFAVAETPKVYFTWDGTPFEELGIHNLVTAFNYTTTVGKTKGRKKRKFFSGGTPKVGNATISFSIPDPQVAQKLNGMLVVKARPEIAFGVKLSYQEGTGGFWVGSMQVDSVRWSYEMGTSLQLTGKKKQVLGMVSHCKPRTWYKVKPSQILKDILDPHGIKVDSETQAMIDKEVNVNTVNLSQTNSESDWEFTQRFLSVLGISDWRIENQTRTIELPSEDDKDKPYTVDRVKIGQQTQIRREALAAASQLQLRISESAGFERFEGKPSKVPVVVGYAPGLTDEGVTKVDVLASSVTVEQTGYKSRPTLVTASKKGVGTVGGFALGKLAADFSKGKSAGYKATGIVLKEDSKSPVKKKVLSGRALGNRNFLVKDKEGMVPNAPEFTAIVKEPSDSCITVNPARRLAALGRNHGLHPKVNVTISPGVPSLRAGDVVNLVGTVAHDSVYGVEESTLMFNVTTGLSTKITLKPISRAGKKSTGKKKKQFNLINWKKYVAAVSTEDGKLKYVPVSGAIVENGEIKLVSPEYNRVQEKNPDLDILKDQLKVFKDVGPVLKRSVRKRTIIDELKYGLYMRLSKYPGLTKAAGMGLRY